MRTALCCLALAIATWATGRVAAADQGSEPNTADQVRQLRQRLDALEKELADAHEAHPAPATVKAGSSYMNLSFDVLANAGWASTPDVERVQPGGHDPSQRGFSIRNAELAVDGAVDPYFKGFASVVLMTDAEDETEIELEEAYALTTGLPAGLQVKAGRFFAEFGRHNNQHPHAWAFVDQPLVLNRMFGSDGLRQNGLRLSWLLPVAHFTEIELGAFNGQGEDAYSFRYRGPSGEDGMERVYGRATVDRPLEGPGDFLYVPRLTTSLDLTDSQTLVLGASAALGPNATAKDSRTAIVGLDAFWKWKSPRAEGGWPFMTLQTEVLARNLQAGEDAGAGIPSETLRDWGLYGQVQWGFQKGWIAGLRAETVTGSDSAGAVANAERPEQTRLSPNVTWYPTEFSKLRLQYNHLWQEEGKADDAVWLQLEFLLGSHAHHKY